MRRATAALAAAGLFLSGALTGWFLNRRIEATHQTFALAIDSVVLLRSAGFGTGPSYKISFTKSGHVIYEGYRSLSSAPTPAPVLGREGVYVGNVEPAVFDRLVAMAEQLGLRQHNEPFVPGVDSGYTLLTLAGSSEHLDVVARPLIEQIDSTLRTIEWRKARE